MSSKVVLDNMKSLLLSQREALRAALQGDLSALKELQSSADVIDLALDAAQEALSGQLAEIAHRELAQIEEALARMSAGGYGSCEECEQAIPLARLKALPYATLCIECQRKAEKPAAKAWSFRVDNS